MKMFSLTFFIVCALVAFISWESYKFYQCVHDNDKLYCFINIDTP